MVVFDKEAIAYDSWYETILGTFVDEVETECVMNLLHLEEGSKVLDIGCGTGNFSVKLAKMNHRVVGIDVSERMLDIAKNKANTNGLKIEFVTMDAHHLELADDSFDCVFSMAVFEFLEYPQKALEEMSRVAKPGSPIIMGIINRDSDRERLYTSREFTQKTVFKYAKLTTPDEIKKLKPQHL